MVISGFEWDDGNIFHIGRHEFTPEEVEEVFAGHDKVRRARDTRYIALGETLGRALSLRGVPAIAGRGGEGDHSPGHGCERKATLSPDVGKSDEETDSSESASAEV